MKKMARTTTNIIFSLLLIVLLIPTIATKMKWFDSGDIVIIGSWYGIVAVLIYLIYYNATHTEEQYQIESGYGISRTA